MKDLKEKLGNTKDKMEGQINETAGKITGNEQLELKGKLQTAKADLDKKLNIKEKVNDAKEDIAKKINDTLDKEKK